MTPGTYELRLYAANGFTLLATSQQITVNAPTLSASPTSVGTGGSVTASWSNVGHPTSTDWVGVYPPGSGSGSYLNWVYDDSCTQTAGSTTLASGSCSVTMPTSPGTYELRLYAANGYKLLASSPQITVGNGIGQCPSAPPGSTLQLGGHTFSLEGVDTFTKSAPIGSFASSDMNAVVYTGDHGMGWTEYPDGWPSTYTNGLEGYQPSTVQSVHDGVLDFYLHNDAAGHPVSANPSPLPSGNRYQTYGVWSFCEKITPSDSTNLDDFYQAPLLWPTNDSDGPSAESDFPEGPLSAGDFSAYAHYSGGQQDQFNIESVDPSFDSHQWHVYTQAWGPGYRSYYVDGQLLGTSTNHVWSSQERFQLQVEPSGRNDGGAGHVYVSWFWIGAPVG